MDTTVHLGQSGTMTVERIRSECATIEALSSMASLRPDVVAEESVRALAAIIEVADQMRTEMLRAAHEAGVGVRALSRASGLSHVTVGRRLRGPDTVGP